MYHRAHQFAVVVIITGLCASAWAAPPKAKATARAPVRGKAVGAPSHPEPLFKSADLAFAKGDRKMAAADLRKAAAALRAQTARAPKEDKAAVDRCAAEIDKLAQDIAKVDSKQMRQAFARADLALGRYHHRQAGQAWANKQSAAAGTHLMAAEKQVEHAAMWMGFKGTPQQIADTQNAALVGQELAQGAEVSPEEAAKAYKLIGSEIQGLSGMIGPPK